MADFNIPSKKIRQSLSMYERFMCYVYPEPNSGCWLWVGYLNEKGYGRFNTNSKLVLSHRFTYETFCGAVPDGLMLRHKCDVKCCCNPDHLELGTNRDNMDDMLKRDGSGKKLNNSIVREIKAELYFTKSYRGMMNRLSEKYGINHTGICAIKAGAKWGHVMWPDGSVGRMPTASVAKEPPSPHRVSPPEIPPTP